MKDFNSTRSLSPDLSDYRTSRFWSIFTCPVSAFERSRPAADATREAVQRWLLEGLDVSVGHRRCSRDPSSKNDAGRTPAS
jgi:hypothetical protein